MSKTGCKPKRHVFLASSSPRRTEILYTFNVHHTLIKNRLENENLMTEKKSLKSALRYLAYEKALSSKASYKGLILGVDTTVVLGKKILGKPSSLSEAMSTLSDLSGKTHQVISAFCLYDSILNSWISRTDTAHVTFKSLSQNDIKTYCSHYEVLDKAGSYGIQDIKKTFVSDIKGSYYTIMGLPINRLLKLLEKYDIV